MTLSPFSPSATPGLAAFRVELVVLTVIDAELKVMLVKRTAPPFEGTWALPGDFVQTDSTKTQGEDLQTTTLRTLLDHTGLDPATCFLQQIRTFGRAGRDPRMRVISVASCVLIPPEKIRVPAVEEAESFRWFSTSEEVPWIRMAFDHAEILQMGIEHTQQQLDTGYLAFYLLPQSFTVSELKSVYEAVKSKRYDPRNFRRRFQRMLNNGLVEELPGKRHLGKSRPAQEWRWIGQEAKP